MDRDNIQKYIRLLTGQPLGVNKNLIETGHLVSFFYKQRKTGRKVQRLVFVLNKKNLGTGIKIHGINLSMIPLPVIKKFIRIVMVKDTVAILKRKFELKGPFSKTIDRPISFYQRYIKTYLSDYDCYRTYNFIDIKRPNIYLLNFDELNVYPSSIKNEIRIGSGDSIKDILREKEIIFEQFGISFETLTLFEIKQLISKRFGGVDKFLTALQEVENIVDDNEK